jgi:dihydrofolate reductase
MRKIVVGEFISLDGVVEAPETWHMGYLNEEMFGVMWALNDRCDTMLLGRNTFESFAGAFADGPADDPVVARMNRPAKVVVSSTLTDPGWANSTVLSGDVIEGITALKAKPGKDIVTTGSTRLVRTMLRAGLVDELSLLVHPVAVGKGQRLFEGDAQPLPLTLVESAAFSTGVVHLHYARACSS